MNRCECCCELLELLALVAAVLLVMVVFANPEFFIIAGLIIAATALAVRLGGWILNGPIGDAIAWLSEVRVPLTPWTVLAALLAGPATVSAVLILCMVAL